MPSRRHFFAAKLVILNKTRRMLWPSAKDKAPVLDTSNCIDEFTCICGTKYLGRTKRCLSTRIKDHLPKSLLQLEEKIRKVQLRSIYWILNIHWIINCFQGYKQTNLLQITKICWSMCNKIAPTRSLCSERNDCILTASVVNIYFHIYKDILIVPAFLDFEWPLTLFYILFFT